MPYQEQNFGTGFLGSLNESLQSQNIGKFILQSILQGHQRALENKALSEVEDVSQKTIPAQPGGLASTPTSPQQTGSFQAPAANGVPGTNMPTMGLAGQSQTTQIPGLAGSVGQTSLSDPRLQHALLNLARVNPELAQSWLSIRSLGKPKYETKEIPTGGKVAILESEEGGPPREVGEILGQPKQGWKKVSERVYQGQKYAMYLDENNVPHELPIGAVDQKASAMQLENLRFEHRKALATMQAKAKGVNATQYLKVWQPAIDSENRYQTMVESFNEIQDALQRGDDTNIGAYDTNLLFNHIGMTLSAQKGTRITYAEIQQAIGARSLPQNLMVQWDKLQTGGFLSEQQREAFLQLADTRRQQTYSSQQQVARRTGLAEGSDWTPGWTPEQAPQEGTQAPQPSKKIKRTGTLNGKKVIEYEDGTVEYRPD